MICPSANHSSLTVASSINISATTGGITCPSCYATSIGCYNLSASNLSANCIAFINTTTYATATNFSAIYMSGASLIAQIGSLTFCITKS